MNATLSSPADPTAQSGGAAISTPPGSAPAARTTIWDVPVRVFHWLMVACFAGAWLTAESERLRLVHVTLGYTMLGLVVFRLAWGVIGTRYARFSEFVKGPRAVLGYLRSLLRGRPEHHAGHNPAGAIAILLMLALVFLVTGSGWVQYNDLAGGWVEEVHEAAANALLGVVIVHVAGVLIASWLHRENLPRAMLTGTKPGQPGESIPGTRRAVGVLMLVAVLGFWGLQWQDASGLPGSARIETAQRAPGDGPAATQRSALERKKKADKHRRHDQDQD